MEVIKNLLIRFRQSGVLLFIGFLLIIYIAFGFVYWQQSSKQGELEEQVANISLIVDKPLASKEKLKADYDEVNSALASVTDSSDAIAILVSIAEKSGIDVASDSDKLIVPPAAVREETVGGGTYQVFSFKNVSVQGDYDNVMAFISDLDSGTTQETMVLTRITINQVEIKVEGEEVTEGEEEEEEEEETEGEEEVEISTRIEANATLDVDLYTKL